MSRSFFSVLFVLCAAASASAQTVVVVDARGAAAQTRKTVKTSASATAKVTNKNPFLFKYRTTINETVVSETAPIAFIGQLNPLLTAAAAAAATGTAGPSGGGERRTGEWKCDAGVNVPQERKNEIVNVDGRLRDAEDDVQTRLLEALTGYATGESQFEAARNRLHNPDAGTDELKKAIDAIKQSKDAFPSPKTLDTIDGQIRDAAVTAKAVAGAIDAFQKAYPSCRLMLTDIDLLITDRAHADNVAGWWQDANKADVTRIRQALDAVKAAITAADLAVAENQFEETHVFGNYDAPTNVVVTVERWPVSDSDDKNKFVVAKTTLLFGGGARFMLTGGLGASLLFGGTRRQEFQPVQGFEKKLDGTTGAALVRVVGLKRDQQILVTPALFLNTRIWAAGDQTCVIHSVSAALGVTAKKDGDVDVDYLAGLSFGMMNDKVVLTAAWYWAQVASLGGNLYVSAAIPDSMTTIPVQKRTASGITLLIGFKIK